MWSWEPLVNVPHPIHRHYLIHIKCVEKWDFSCECGVCVSVGVSDVGLGVLVLSMWYEFL